MIRILRSILVILMSSDLFAQVPYNNFPDWFSTETTYYGTGSSIDDINGDGYPDLAITNGNDMAISPNFAYINSYGILPHSASWISSNTACFGHCEMGDYDRDGFPELAVSNFISSPGNWGPGRAIAYDNVNGSLLPEPSWISADPVYTFRLTWGDADSDGDLDLAVATGEPYHSYFETLKIYYNIDGVLQTVPGWTSFDQAACLDIKWVDIDLDGDLDLAACESVGHLKLYYNYGDSIATLPGWMSATEDDCNSIDFADINGDSYPDLAVATNIQVSGTGKFKIYLNDNGMLQTQPFWQSYTAGYGSEAAFTDIDNDGDNDLVCGRWWGLIYVYLNNDGQFNVNSSWNSSGNYQSVVENIVFGDFNRGAERNYRQAFESSGQRLFYLPHRQIAGIDSVRVNGDALDLNQYCASHWDGWISIGFDVIGQVEVFYRYSVSKDMAVSNWDRETFIFHNTNPGFVPGDVNDSGHVDGLDIVFLVNFIKGGKTPLPRLAADANGDCLVNAVDVVYLLSYLTGGPAPLAGYCD